MLEIQGDETPCGKCTSILDGVEHCPACMDSDIPLPEALPSQALPSAVPTPLLPVPACPIPGSGDLNNDNMLTSYDVFLVGAIFVQDTILMDEIDLIGCDIFAIADGNQDGVVDLLDSSGFAAIVFDGICPIGFEAPAPWILDVCE